MIALLHKLAINKGKQSGIRAGHSAVAPFSIVKSSKPDFESLPDSEKLLQDAKFSDIEVGDMVLVASLDLEKGTILDNNFIRTSPVTKIIESSDVKVVFETRSSTYELLEFKVEDQH